MIRLLNSAVMPCEGTYTLRALDEAEFVERLRSAPEFVSYIGYEQTASYIEQIAGVPVPISRERTTLDDGDELLIIRLAYRVAPGMKDKIQDREEWEYFLATYRSP